MQPLVSIIIPVFNNERYLAGSIKSAIDQLYANKEIIIVDDGSTDNTLQVALGFESENVKIFHQENKGASSARNMGLSHARGIYIQFLDADDLLGPDKIATQVEALEGQEDVMAVCSTVHFKDGEDYQQRSPSAYEEQFLWSTNDPVGFMVNLWGGNNFNASMVQPNAWLTPRKLIDGFGNWNEGLTLDDDGEFFARMVLNSKGIVKTGGLNYYRKYPLSTKNLASQKNSIGLQSAYQALILKKRHLFEKTNSEQAKKAIFRLLTELSTTCYLDAPEIYNKAQKQIKELPPYRFNVVLGGTMLNFISRIWGWRMAKQVQRLYYNLKA